MSYGVTELELLTEDAVLRRVQGVVMSYKFRTGLGVNKAGSANPSESSVRGPTITGRGVPSEQVSNAQVAS